MKFQASGQKSPLEKYDGKIFSEISPKDINNNLVLRKEELKVIRDEKPNFKASFSPIKKIKERLDKLLVKLHLLII